jgi:hypothetical protein
VILILIAFTRYLTNWTHSRVCLDKVKNPPLLATYQRDLYKALSGIEETSLLDLTRQSMGLSMDSISSKLCLIRRMSRDEVDDDIYISPITDYVEVQLGVRLRLLEPRAQVQMYEAILQHTRCQRDDPNSLRGVLPSSLSWKDSTPVCPDGTTLGPADSFPGYKEEKGLREHSSSAAGSKTTVAFESQHPI